MLFSFVGNYKNYTGYGKYHLNCCAEHGRNSQTNGRVDSFGREGTDHTGDAMSRDVFTMVLGHQTDSFVNTNSIIDIEKETIDIVPTVANILGFDNDIPAGRINGNVLNEAFN